MKKKNATSLFDEIPIGRTCQSAGVAVHWCMCTYTQTSSLNVSTGVEWQLTADWVVSRINELLRPAVEAQLCQPLALMRVVDAHYLIPTDLVRTHADHTVLPVFSHTKRFSSSLHCLHSLLVCKSVCDLKLHVSEKINFLNAK